MNFYIRVLIIEVWHTNWRRSIVGRTLVSAQQTASWMADHFVVKPSAIG